MDSYIGKHVYIKSVTYSRHVGCTDKGLSYSHKNRGSWEKFHLSGSQNILLIKSFNGYYIATNSTGKIYFTNNAGSSTAKWRLEYAYGHIVIRSNYNNRFLNFTDKSQKAEFYQHCSYGGDVKELGVGNYPDVSKAGIRNDDLSSLIVPNGIKVTLYEHSNFNGKNWTIQGNTKLDCFTNNTMSTKRVGWRWHARTVNISWNDQVSSIKIERTDEVYSLDTVSKASSSCYVDLTEPNEFSLSWSTSGIPYNMTGISCNVPQKPASSLWKNNYLCSNVELPWKWVTNQTDLNKWTNSGYTFTRFIEAADPHFTSYPIGICVPKRTNIELQWTSSSNNVDSLRKDGYKLVRIFVPAEKSSHTWWDNWLAYKLITPKFDKFNIGFGIEVWSGGWASASCMNKKREGVFKVNINGREIGRGSRGITMMIVDEIGNKLYQGSFDTHSNKSNSNSLISQINRLTSNINDDRIVIFGVQDEAVNNLTPELKSLMVTKGAAMFSQLLFRGSYIFIYRPRDGLVAYEGLDNCGDVYYKYDCGVLCTNIYSKSYYQEQYQDVQDPDTHWSMIGIKEGRQAHPKFDPKDYRLLYEDVSNMNNEQAAKHFVQHGAREGRIGTIFEPKYGFGGLLTNHLTCFLDAGNKDSYSEGKTWKDVSGNNNHFEFQTTPLSDGLSMLDIHKFGNTATLPDISKLNISPKGGYTIIMVARQKELKDNFAIWSGNAKNRLYSHWVWSNYGTYIGNEGCCRSSYTVPKDSWNKEMMIAYVFTIDGGLDIFIDGKRVVRGPRDKTKSFASTGNLMLNHNNTWKANIKMFMVYNYGMPKSYIKNIWNWYDKTNKARLIQKLDDSEKLAKQNLPLFPIQRGLQLYISSNNVKSYQHGNLTVKDLSGNNRNFVFDKKPKLIDGKWIVEGYNTLKGPVSSSIGIDGDSDYCIIFRIKTNTMNDCSLFNIYGTHKKNRGIFFHPIMSSRIMHYDQGESTENGLLRLSRDIPNEWNTITTYALSRNSKGRHIYINGIKVLSNSDRGTDINFAPDRMELFSTKHYKIWNGEMSDFIVFNQGLSSRDILKVTKYINNPYTVKNSSWNEASQYCLSQGKQLCQLDELCFGGKTIDPTSFPNAQAPIGDRPGSWVNLSNCEITQNNQSVTNAHIKCCPLPKRAPYFETCYYKDGLIHFFKDSMVLKYEINTHISEGPINLTNEYPNLPSPFNEGNFDAVCSVGNNLYIVKDKVALIYDIVSKKPIASPGTISQIFPGITSMFVSGYIDVILQHPFDMNILYVIKGNKFCSYNISNKTSTPPHRLNGSGGWGGLTGFFSGKLNAGITFKKTGNGFLFFKEDQYYDYSKQVKGNIVPDWHGLTMPFVTEGQYCSILNTRIEYFRKETEKFRGSNPELYKRSSSILKIANDNKRKYCEQVSVQEYLNRLQKERDRQVSILAKIKNLQFKQGQSVNQAKLLVKEKNRLVAIIDDLNIKIEIEQKKTCPINAVCKKNEVPITKITKNKTKQQCTPSMMTHLMKKQGYTQDQIDQLSNTFNYVPTINDYDIRTHKSFFEYVEKGGVKLCPNNKSNLNSKEKTQRINAMQENMSPNELLESLYSTNKYKEGLKQLDMLDHAQRKREIKQIVKQHEDIAVKLLREAVLKYHMKHVADKLPDFLETAQNAQSVNQFTKATNDIVSNIKLGKGVAMHLALLKEIQNILKDVTQHPKYISLTSDIKKITKEIKHDSKKLAKTTITQEVNALQDKLNKSHKLLLKKTGKLEKLISTLKVKK